MESFAKKILDAEARWIWFPDEREMIETEVYTLAVNQRNPGRITVVRFVLTPKSLPNSRVHAGRLVQEILETVREKGGKRISWILRPTSVPNQEAMAEILRQNGFRCAYALEILGWDLGEDSKPRLPGRPMDVKTELVNDARSLDEACYVHEEVMGSSALGGQSREEVLESMTVPPNQRERDRVVAYIGGKAVAFGGFDVVDGIARLWGACTLREYRRRGCYTAVLRTRCQHAHARGATGALVFGQPDTSALILKRLGFHQAGVTYTYQAEL